MFWKLFGSLCIVVGSYLLYERDQLATQTGFDSVNQTTENLGIAILIIGIPIILFTLFGIVATFRENITILKIVCILKRTL